MKTEPRPATARETNLLFSTMILVTIASGAIAGTGTGVFAHPENYVGKTVTVCGYVEDRSEDRNRFLIQLRRDFKVRHYRR
jgi:hypothetical protein